MENKNVSFQPLYDLEYSFNDFYKITYLTPKEYDKASNCLSFLRKNKLATPDEIYTLTKMYSMFAKKYFTVKELIYQEPRRHAQLFIGKKKIRNFILKRDKYKCLCCGSKEKLSIDHIHSIHFGGENKLSNLQTLCKSCNSRKSTNYKDYR
jgi:hypothetical protein